MVKISAKLGLLFVAMSTVPLVGMDVDTPRQITRAQCPAPAPFTAEQVAAVDEARVRAAQVGSTSDRRPYSFDSGAGWVGRGIAAHMCPQEREAAMREEDRINALLRQLSTRGLAQKLHNLKSDILNLGGQEDYAWRTGETLKGAYYFLISDTHLAWGSNDVARNSWQRHKPALVRSFDAAFSLSEYLLKQTQKMQKAAQHGNADSWIKANKKAKDCLKNLTGALKSLRTMTQENYNWALSDGLDKAAANQLPQHLRSFERRIHDLQQGYLILHDSLYGLPTITNS